MKNNQYTATPNWFKDVQQQQQVVTTQTNYYIGGASGGGLQSINLYNKFTIESYRLTVDDLLIKNTAIIAADTPLAEGEERPEDFVSEIGKAVTVENWHTSYVIEVIAGTTMKANLKANTNRYGIVFYDEYNQPISGYTPIKDELVTIDIPEKARYFRCCHYIEPTTEPVESTDSEIEETVEPTYKFYIEYTGIGSYNDSDLNTAYGGIFENFTNVNSSVPEGINTKQLNTSGLNLIFQQPLSCTVDKSSNIKIGLDKVFTESVRNAEIITENDTTTTPSDTNIFSALRTLKEIKKVIEEQDLWKLIEDEQGNKYIITDYNVVGKGGITAYYKDDLNPGGSGGLGSGGSIANIQVIGKGNALSDVTLSEDKSLLTFTKLEVVQKDWITAELRKYVDKESAQEITGLKNFINGLSIGSKLLNVIDGVLYINCDVAVTGGVTTYALGSTDVSTIMDGITVDGITISKENGVLKVIGDIGGASNWDELEGKPSWITDTKPTYTWSEITSKPTTLSGYGITANDVLNTLKTVDGAGSGLDADMLDGKHALEFQRDLYTYTGSDLTAADTTLNPNIFGMVRGLSSFRFFDTKFYASVSSTSNRAQIAYGYDSDVINFRRYYDGKWNAWRTIAFVDSVVNSSKYIYITEISDLNNPTYFSKNIKCLTYETYNSSALNIPVVINNVNGLITLYKGYHNTSGQFATQLAFPNNERMYLRIANAGTWHSWHTVAYLTDNVASATKLQTTRYIWGQPFNGERNVTGALTSVTNITASGSISCNTITTTGSVTTGGNITISNGSDSRLTIRDGDSYLQQQNISDLGGYGLYLYGSNGTRIANKLVVDSNAYLKGNVGIGTISPSTKLHVAGNILSTGGITCYSSDQRAKTVIEQINLSLKQIANAPTIRFKWNDWKIKDDGKTHIGGIAQYMQKLLPETVLEADDMLNMDYATTGYIFAVQTAKHLVKTDTEVERLKNRVKKLEKQLKQLGYEEANIMGDKDV